MIGGAEPTPQRVTGIVIAADGPDSATVDTFTLRTADGRLVNFNVGTLDVANGLPAPHLREHLVNGEPITVTFQVQNGVNVATRYVDAEPSSSTP